MKSSHLLLQALHPALRVGRRHHGRHHERRAVVLAAVGGGAAHHRLAHRQHHGAGDDDARPVGGSAVAVRCSSLSVGMASAIGTAPPTGSARPCPEHDLRQRQGADLHGHREDLDRDAAARLARHKHRWVHDRIEPQSSRARPARPSATSASLLPRHQRRRERLERLEARRGPASGEGARPSLSSCPSRAPRACIWVMSQLVIATTRSAALLWPAAHQRTCSVILHPTFSIGSRRARFGPRCRRRRSGRGRAACRRRRRPCGSAHSRRRRSPSSRRLGPTSAAQSTARATAAAAPTAP